MNWEIFSPIGYVSIALWLCMPLLWLLHRILGRRGGLVFLAVLVGIASFAAGKINSTTYVNRIQVDRSEEIQRQLDRQDRARMALQEATRRKNISDRLDDAAQIRFAEDSATDSLDLAGLNDDDRDVLDASLTGESSSTLEPPEWKREKKQRSTDAVDNSLEAEIGATQQQAALSVDVLDESKTVDPILMSDRDATLAHRLDAANLNAIQIMCCFSLLAVVLDYLRRANMYQLAYFPLPLPSRWLDTMTPREAVVVRPTESRRQLLAELQVFSRRGESYVFITDSPERAAQATTVNNRLPLGFWPVQILNVSEFDARMDDNFVFETLWYGRNSFVVDTAQRGEQLIMKFLELLADRQRTRARVKQTVHVVWDVTNPIPNRIRQEFAELGEATGYQLWLCHEES